MSRVHAQARTTPRTRAEIQLSHPRNRISALPPSDHGVQMPAGVRDHRPHHLSIGEIGGALQRRPQRKHPLNPARARRERAEVGVQGVDQSLSDPSRTPSSPFSQCQPGCW